MPPPSCSVVSEASETVCTPHTGSFGLPNANETVCTPHTGSFGLPNANEAVCIPHTVSFDLPNANEAVCIPHTVSFGLPDANEQCASHTPLCSSFFIPPHHLGGILSCKRQEQGGMKSTRRLVRAALFPPTMGESMGWCSHRPDFVSFYPPNHLGGDSFLQHR